MKDGRAGFVERVPSSLSETTEPHTRSAHRCGTVPRTGAAPLAVASGSSSRTGGRAYRCVRVNHQQCRAASRRRPVRHSGRRVRAVAAGEHLRAQSESCGHGGAVSEAQCVNSGQAQARQRWWLRVVVRGGGGGGWRVVRRWSGGWRVVRKWLWWLAGGCGGVGRGLAVAAVGEREGGGPALLHATFINTCIEFGCNELPDTGPARG